MAASNFFLVHYRNPKDSKIVSIRAKKIEDSSLGLSFVALSDFIFENHSILVDPEAEAQKLQFEAVKTLHLSIYSILTIAEMGQQPNKLRFDHDKSNLLVLNSESGDAPSS